MTQAQREAKYVLKQKEDAQLKLEQATKEREYEQKQWYALTGV